MNSYQIKQAKTWTVLGIFAGETEADAIDAMAVDAGYESYADMVETVGEHGVGKLEVTQLPHDTCAQ